MRLRWGIAIACALAACTGVQQRFPDDLQTALAHEPMRKLETSRLIIFYAAARRAEVDRFVARADRCAELLRDQAVIHDGPWRDKMVIVMPDVAFNNAFVLPELAGYEEVSVIPLQATLDFSTEFGIPPDPGYIACHELTHYVHMQQTTGMWRTIDSLFGHIYTPQIGYDPWFLEGLATHYEAALSPGVGRPRWPIFTGMFAAGYAGKHVTGGDLSILDRIAVVGNHYLVGSMFVRFLTETYGEQPLWRAIANNASAFTGWFTAGTFRDGFHVGLDELLDRFDKWHAAAFPERRPPPAQKQLATLGNDARYARGRDGTEAWVAEDVDVPPRLVVRSPTGDTLADIALVEVIPPRKLVTAAPLLVSGLSVTADGREVWLTAIDLGATFQIPRTLRWRRGARGLEQIADDLGPGVAISPDGRTFYYCWVDGDSWSLAAYDTHTRARKLILEAKPGTYVLGGQVSPDGAQVVANVWDGVAFVAWVIDARTGRVERTIGGAPEAPVYDASFTGDGRVMWLGIDAGARFQVFVDGAQATDAPYAALAAREAGGTIRFMDREGWQWVLAEVALPTPPPDAAPVTTPPLAASRAFAPPGAAEVPAADEPASPWDHFFFPQERSPTLLAPANGALLVGGVLAGGDRLGLQRWSLAGYLQLPTGKVTRTHFGADVAYLNAMLAPVTIIGAAKLVDWMEQVTPDLAPTIMTGEERRTRDVSLAATHTYRGTLTTALGATYTDDYTRIDDGSLERRVHVGGPQLAVEWASAEVTRYTGARRALIVAASAADYPAALSTFNGNIVDVGGTLGGVVPLPFGRRHTLRADVRGRALLARDDTGLLQLGGDSSPVSTLASGTSVTGAPPTFDTSRFPPNLRFVEPLRGYEDFPITTDRAAIADLAWRYPLIIDRGVAAVLNWLPAEFIRELDFEAFGAGAVDRANARHLAVGAALSLHIQLLRIPLVVTYQLARRLVDDQALTQLVGVSPGP